MVVNIIIFIYFAPYLYFEFLLFKEQLRAMKKEQEAKKKIEEQLAKDIDTTSESSEISNEHNTTENTLDNKTAANLQALQKGLFNKPRNETQSKRPYSWTSDTKSTQSQTGSDLKQVGDVRARSQSSSQIHIKTSQLQRKFSDDNINSDTRSVPKVVRRVTRGSSFREDLLPCRAELDEKQGAERPLTPPGALESEPYSPRLSGKKTEVQNCRKIKLGTKAADLLAKLHLKLPTK